MLSLLKIFSFSLQSSFSFINASNLNRSKPKSISDLKQSVLKKNKQFFPKIQSSVLRYLSISRSHHSLFFDEHTLWTFLDSKRSAQIFKFLLVHDFKLLSIFHDVQDIVRISKSCGASQIFSMILDHNLRASILSKVGSLGFVKIASTDCAKPVFDLILDEANWFKFSDRIPLKQFIAIAQQIGSKYVLEMLLNDDIWFLLKSRLGEDFLFKIASSPGSRHVFDVFLDTDKWLELINKVPKESLLLIACQGGSRNVLDLFLDKSKWSCIFSRIGLDSICFLSKKTGSRKVLDTLINNEFWDLLLLRLKTKENIVKICSNVGSYNVLNLVLLDSLWFKLMDRVPFDSFLSIAFRLGARNVLDFFLNDKDWQRLNFLFDKSEIFKISSHVGARSVFELFLDKDKWSVLSERIPVDVLISISSRDSSCSLLRMFLDNTKWKTLCSRLSKDLVVTLARNSSSRRLFDIILNNSKWHLLNVRLGSETIYSLLKNPEVLHVFQRVIDHPSWGQLRDAVDIQKLVSILISCKSNTLLNFLFDSSFWLKVKDRVNFDFISKISKQDHSKEIFEFIFFDDKWCFFSDLWGLDYLVSFLPKKNSVFKLNNLYNQYPILSNYFTRSGIITFSQINPLDQVGLNDYSLNQLFEVFSFSESQVLVLTKIAGRHLSNILHLFYFHKEYLATLFDFSPKLLSSSSSNSSENCLYARFFREHTLTEDAFYTFSLSLLHQHCSYDSLCVEDLSLLVQLLPLFPNSLRFNLLRRLFVITGSYPVDVRRSLIRTLASNKSILNYPSVIWLFKLPLSLRKWYILRGESYLNFILDPCSVSSFNFTDEDHNFMMLSLKRMEFRVFVATLLFQSSYTILSSSNLKILPESEVSCSILSILLSPLNLKDWLYFTINIYSKIKYCLDSTFLASYSNKLSFLTSSELSLFKSNFPSILFYSDSIHVDIPLNILQKLLSMPCVFNSDIFLSTSRKRLFNVADSNTVSSESSSVCINDSSAFDLVEDFFSNDASSSLDIDDLCLQYCSFDDCDDDDFPSSLLSKDLI